jgi:uncharacterized protein (TIGR03437 family)
MPVRRPLFLLAVLLASAILTQAASRRILYLTATYGFRHGDAIDASVDVFQQLAAESGVLTIDHTEDVSLINAANLRNYDAVYFFTSGELPLSDQQKADLLDYVRSGHGFGGSHSATDSNYSWPEYGDLIGGIFDGHPWAQEAAVDVEDPQSPLVAHAAPGFRFTEEFYQFRGFSRDRVRVLLTLDTRSVDMSAPGINRTDGDFPLAWVRPYGNGRVFYSAFGHFPDSFRLQPIRTMLRQALLWLAGEIQVDAAPRNGPPPGVTSTGSDVFAPGSFVVLGGDHLTSGSSLDAASVPLPVRLAGTHVEVNGTSAPLYSVRPDRIAVQLPANLAPGQNASLVVSSVNIAGPAVPLRIEAAAPVIAGLSYTPGAIVIYCTGLGATDPPLREGLSASGPLRTVVQPNVMVAGAPAPVYYAGSAPGLPGVYQVNVLVPGSLPATYEITLEAAGRVARASVQ